MKIFLILVFFLITVCSRAQDGSLDTSFGTGGRCYSNYTSNNTWSPAVAVQADGKILQVSTKYGGGQTALIRYKVNGSRDSSFGNQGIFFGGGHSPACVAVQPDGKILVAGGGSGSGSQPFIIRVLSNGVLDNSFGINGRVDIPFTTGISVTTGMALQSDGKILITAYYETAPVGYFGKFFLARVTNTGMLDSSFDSDGMVTTVVGDSDDAMAFGLAIQADGKIVVVGHAFDDIKYQMAVVRYTTTGALDPSFGTGGRFISLSQEHIGGKAVAIQPDGKIVVAGCTLLSNYDGDIVVLRLNSNGIPDPGFGSAGIVVTSQNASDFWTSSVAVEYDGKIVVGGQRTTQSNTFKSYPMVARYTSAGSLDPTFGYAGLAITSMTQEASSGYIASQGYKIIVGSNREDQSPNDNSPVIIRLNNSSGFYYPFCNIPAPVVTISGNVLSSSASAGNQWYLDGNAIDGANGQTYTATKQGIYSVLVSSNICTGPPSNKMGYYFTAIEPIADDWQLEIAPNPVNNMISIKINGAEKYSLEILDLTGRRVMVKHNFNGAALIDCSGFASGTYLVHITNQKTKKEINRLIVKS